MQVPVESTIETQARLSARSAREWIDALPGWVLIVVVCILIAWSVLWFCLPFFVYFMHTNIRDLKASMDWLVRRIDKLTTQQKPPGS
jgi:hypothetical protein